MADPCDIIEDVGAASGFMPGSVVKPTQVLESSGTLADAVIQGFVNLVVEHAEAADIITDSRGNMLTSHAAAAGFVVSNAAVLGTLVTDRAQARSMLVGLHADLATAGGELGVVVLDGWMADLVRDTARASADAVATVVAVELAKASMTGRGAILRLVYERLTETSASGDGTAASFITATDTATDTGEAASLAQSQAHARDMARANAAFNVVVLDQLAALERIRDDAWADGAVLGEANGMTWWTAATDTFGMSRYLTLPVQSLAVVAGELMAVSATGVYVRAGATDNGAKLDAYVRTGLYDFGADYLKRVDHLYVGYVSDGSMQVDVGETSTGEEITYSYTMPPRAATAPTHGRTRLGRGLRSLYYRFTLRNTNGERLGITRAGVDVNNTGRKV